MAFSQAQESQNESQYASEHEVSAAEDISSASDSDQDYQTDFTTPAGSESNSEDMPPDDVEEFRDQEYPQLRGKTYLDHGGTTVCD